MELTDEERNVLLAALFEFRMSNAENATDAQIEALVAKLGGDAATAFFGAYRRSAGAAPVPEYPADETDEG
jgi:hypothetical protein